MSAINISTTTTTYTTTSVAVVVRNPVMFLLPRELTNASWKEMAISGPSVHVVILFCFPVAASVATEMINVIPEAQASI